MGTGSVEIGLMNSIGTLETYETEHFHDGSEVKNPPAVQET